jgi:transcriptional regulator GlxA family with amidase domain
LSFEESRYRRIKPSRHLTVSAPLKEVVRLMDANLEEPLELEQLAEYAGRSRRQIERLFKEQLGTTPQRYYLELRITEARRLLQHTELSQVDVLVACGFVSPSHFSKCWSSERRLDLPAPRPNPVGLRERARPPGPRKH